MMNVIRAGNSCFRSNCKIIYKQIVVTPQCSFCSSSQGDDNNKKGNDKKEGEKPVNVKRKIRHAKLESSRSEKGKEAIQALLRNVAVKSKSKDLDKEGKKIEDDTKNLDDTTMGDVAFKTNDRKPIKVPLPSRTKSAKKSSGDLLKFAREAAVELGGDVESTQNDLMNAYQSVKERQFQRKPMQRRKYAEDPSNRESFGSQLNVNRISDGEGLGIFTTNVTMEDKEPLLPLWKKLHEAALQDLTMSPPKNYFEELILWTHHGKLWHFPIDNEQDMKVEENTDFTEHIFLDVHLEPWCPKAGPLRHFMELVTVGLSKNPYLSVEQKKEHIYWYKDYFESKKKLLNDLGALDPVSTDQAESN